MNRRVLVVVSALAVGAGVLAGCTSPAEEPTPSPSANVTPSPSVSATPTLTAEEQLLAQIPEEAKGDDLLAAVEMAKFFVTLHPGLYQGEDPALFEFLSLPECEFCSSSLDVTRERIAEGTIQIGGEVSVPEQVEESVLDLDTEGSTTALVGFRMLEDAHRTIDSNGAELRSSNGGEYQIAVALRHVEGIWRVYGLEVD